MKQTFDRSMVSYKIAMESFGSMALDQPIEDRMTYRTFAMEAIAGPDTGMVVDRLYKGLMSRAGINFGKIPDSTGDISRFIKYKSIVESMALLDRQTQGQKIQELELAHDLHNNIVRLRDSFVYGFKMDSQFLKITYNTMVYSLCELLNLCDVIYIDMLKAAYENKQFQYKPYDDLLLVQNIKRFNEMVRSGEWDQMMLSIRKDSDNLMGFLGSTMGGTAPEGILHFLTGNIGKIGFGGAYVKMASNAAGKAAAGSKEASIIFQATQGLPKAAFTKMMSSVPGKVVAVILIIVSTVLIVRGLISLFWKATYRIHEMLEDNEKLLKAHMEIDAQNGVSENERQRALYETLSSLRNKIENSILKDDIQGKKELKKANAEEANKRSMTPPSSDSDAELVLG